MKTIQIQDAIDLLDTMYSVIHSPNGRIRIDTKDYYDSEMLLQQAKRIAYEKSLNVEFA